MEKITVYTWNDNKYISGYDYVKINKEAVMGIDSLMGYYKIGEDFLQKIKDNYIIELKVLPLMYRARVREEYHDDLGDAIYRMKNFGYEDLLAWKTSMDEVKGTSFFDPVKYDLLCKEINKRQENDETKNEILGKIMLYIESLKEEYGSIVNEVINQIPEEMKKGKRIK